jgi:HEAT repeat protein
MPNVIQRRVAFLVSLVVVLGIISFYWTRGHGPFWKLSPAHNEQFPNRAASNGTEGVSAAPSTRLLGSSNIPQAGDALLALEEWLRLISSKDGSSISDRMRAIMQSLQSNPNGNAEFYERARQVLMDQSLDIGRKLELVRALDRAATPSAFQLLADLAKQDLPASLKISVFEAIGHVGDYYWDKQSLAQVSPLLEQLWQQSEDPELLRTAATAMARVGDLTSINDLIEAVLADNRSLAEIEQSVNPRVSAAWSALRSLQKPEIVPILRRELQSNGSLFEKSIYATLLAEMGSIEATQALLYWAQSAGNQCAPIVRDAFLKIGTFDCLQYLNAAMAQNPSFKSASVRDAVLSALKK